MTKLPNSFAVLNDWGEIFKDVIKYLFPYTFDLANYIQYEGWYFGVSRQVQPIYTGNKNVFDTILTLEQFLNTIKE